MTINTSEELGFALARDHLSIAQLQQGGVTISESAVTEFYEKHGWL